MARVVKRCQEFQRRMVLVETDLPLSGLETLLHRPSNPCYAHEVGKGDQAGRPAAVEGQLTGRVVAADQDAVPAIIVRVSVSAHVSEPGPVVVARPFRPVSGTAPGPRPGGQVGSDEVGAAAGLAAVERQKMVAGDGHDVAETQFPQLVAQTTVVAVGLVRSRPPGRDPRVDRCGDHVLSHLRTSGERDVVRDARLLTPLAVARP
jgi:hypothetical protein